VHIKDNGNLPHDKSHRFLFPVSGKFPGLNFAPFRPICSLRDTNSEPGLPVVRAGAEKMAPKKRACSKPELYSVFTVCTELQHCRLNG